MTTRQGAFGHCKFGTGAKPGAYRKMPDGSEFSMSSADGWVSVTRYPADFCSNRSAKAQRNIPLRDCPADGWEIYWTCEA